ncbi:MAG: phage replication initiation protein, NGO0469 family [Thiohalomonadales bacterium]
MALCPPSKATFEGVSEGTHVAVCVKVIDIGLQDSPYGTKQQVLIEFEVPGERVEYTDESGTTKEGPKTIGKFYNFTLVDGSNLRKDMESWRGKAFKDDELMNDAGDPIWDVGKVLRAPCQLGIIKNEKGKSLINGIMGLPKGFPAPAIEGEAFVYDAEHPENLTKLSDGLQKIIAKQITPIKGDSKDFANQSLPLQTVAPPPGVGDDFDDDIPF